MPYYTASYTKRQFLFFFTATNITHAITLRKQANKLTYGDEATQLEVLQNCQAVVTWRHAIGLTESGNSLITATRLTLQGTLRSPSTPADSARCAATEKSSVAAN